MNVFTPFIEPFRTAKALDPLRLNKQVIECEQIIKAIQGQSKAWHNHPAVLQYRDHLSWLRCYMLCLKAFRKHDIKQARMYDYMANYCTPGFIDEAWCLQMRKRLFTKDPVFYASWKVSEPTYENWYFVDNKIVFYRNGRRVE